MSFTRSRSISPLPRKVNCIKSPKVLKSCIKPRFCKICADKASIIKYGTLSCSSCKTFFRRNSFHPETVRSCSLNGLCEVNMKTRGYCTACRLDKCLRLGMSSDLIRKEEQQKSRCSSTSKFKTTPPVLFLQDLLLTNYEWTLLTNIIEAHDEFSITPQLCRLIETLSKLPDEMQCDETNTCDIVILMYESILFFISSSLDFHMFTVNEQSFLERNLHAITIFYFILVFRDTTLIYKSKCDDLFKAVHGPEIIFQVKSINKQLDFDSTIVGLLWIVFGFSSNNFIINVHKNMLADSLLYSTHCLVRSQNVSIELLWKYMIYRHGFSNSVCHFSRLIGEFLNLIKYSAIAYMNTVNYHKLVDNALKKMKQLLITDSKEHVQL
ncbi:unnamed protein product [Rotaria socialis]